MKLAYCRSKLQLRVAKNFIDRYIYILVVRSTTTFYFMRLTEYGISNISRVIERNTYKI